jgi:hypothetical protein
LPIFRYSGEGPWNSREVVDRLLKNCHSEKADIKLQ